jgi:hypothetical protein
VTGKKLDALDVTEGRSLHDLVEGRVEASGREALDYHGLFLQGANPENGSPGDIRVQAEGHVGTITYLSSEDYDDVLELVDDLDALRIEWENHIEHGSLEDLVEFAGPKVTADSEKAEDSDLHHYVPPREEVEA